MSNGFVFISPSNAWQFSNAASNDLLFYTQSNSQKLVLGVGGGNAFGQANLTISSNLTSFSGDLAITNAISIKGLTIMQSDGTTANVTSVASIPGFSNDNAGVVLSMASNTSNYSFRFVSTSNEFMRINGRGRIGIGTSNPSATLDVAGTIQVRSNMVAPQQSNLVWDFSGTATAWAGSMQAGPISASNLGSSNVVVSTLTPFSNLNTEGSVYFPGTVGSYIYVAPLGSLAAPNNTPMPDFTIEGWVWPVAAPTSNYALAPNLMGSMVHNMLLDYWSFGISSNNLVSFYAYASSTSNTVFGNTTVSNQTWSHIAVCYTSNTRALQMYVNGTQQTLTTAGNALSGNGTATATLAASVVSQAQLSVGQMNNIPFNGYVNSLRYVVGQALYSSSFTPSTVPLNVVGSNTRFLLRAPLSSSVITNASVDSSVMLRSRSLPSDAVVYADCFGTSVPVVASNLPPVFDSNNSLSIVINRSSSNSLVMPAQLLNIATSGFTFVIKSRCTGTASAWEDMLAISGSNGLIYYERGNTAPSFGFGLRNTAIAGDVYIVSPSIVMQNQTNVHIGRYDPFKSGTASLFVNGSLVASSSNNAANLRDTVFTSLSVGTNGFNGEIQCCAIYNRPLSDKEVAEATALLMDNPSTTNTLEVGVTGTGKPALVVTESGNIQVAGQLAGANNLSWNTFDAGVSNLSIGGYVYGSLPALGMSPYASRAGDGSMYFNGSVSNYVVFPSGVANPYTGGAQDVTFEAWIYITQTANINMIMGRASSPSSGVNDWGIYVNNTSLISYVYGANNTQYIASHHVSLLANTWNHVAMTVASGVVRVFLNGLVGNTTATIVGNARYNAGYNTYLGCFNNTVNNMFYGYMANVRIVSGLAAYTASFTPPTSPLGPAPSGTTLLCMRVQQGSGRVIIPRIGGTRNVQAYPPAAMTGYLTNIQNATYGAGIYIASASSDQGSANGLAYMAFDKTNGTTTGLWWGSGTYANSTGIYSGSASTIDVVGTSYSGEWVQLQMPLSITLTHYSIQIQPNGTSNSPNTFYLFGSTNGTAWYLVNQQSGVNSWVMGGTITFVANSSQGYNYYRLLATKTNNNSGGTAVFAISELVLYGTQESINVTPEGQVGIGVSRPLQALEVAGNAVFGGNISAGNIGMFRNKVINGDMRIAQRGTSTVVSLANTNTYILDRVAIYVSNANVITISQVALTASDIPYSCGFQYSYRALVTTANATTSAIIEHGIEGYNMSDLMWGTSYGKPVTISMWIRSNAPSGSLMNIGLKSGLTASYGAQYTYTTSGAWQYVTVTVQPPSPSFVWDTGSNRGLRLVLFASWSGSSAPRTWISGNIYNYTGESLTFFQTLNNYVQITGVQLEVGTMATPFEFRPYGTELQLCQRYFIQYNYTSGDRLGPIFNGSGTVAFINWFLPAQMRATMAVSGTTSLSYGGGVTGIGRWSAGLNGSPQVYVSINTSGLTGGAFGGFAEWTAANQYIRFDAEF